MEYLDFVLEIHTGRGLEYPVSVIHSPAGEARATMHFPYDELALENRLLALHNALLRSGGKHRRAPSSEERTIRDFGEDIFDALITGEISNRYDVSREKALQQGKGLRVKLRIQSPELAALPWEFLFDRRQAEYVSLSRETPIVRYLELPQPPQPLEVTPPIKILGLVASPEDLKQLDVEIEKQRVEKALHDLSVRNLVHLEWLEGQSWRHLQHAMRGGPWHIFHFIGHGGFDQFSDEGVIFLADSKKNAFRLSATQLGRLLAAHRSLRLVFLNACEGAKGSERDIFSSTSSILVRRGIPAVLAMQYEITDRAAIEFARAFYEAIVDGMPVDAAVAEARVAITIAVNNTVEWGTPVIYMRAPNGRIFDTKSELLPPPIEPTDKELESRIKNLYTQGLGAFHLENWEDATNYFQAVFDLTTNYEDASEKLEESKRQLKLNSLYDKAQRSINDGDLRSATDTLEVLVNDEPNFRDARVKLEDVRKKEELANLYTEAKHLRKADDWRPVLEIFTKIRTIDTSYPDPDELFSWADDQSGAHEREEEIEQLFSNAVRKLEVKQWQEARELLLQVRKIEPSYAKAESLLVRIEQKLTDREAHLADLYEQVTIRQEERDWAGALKLLNEIETIKPDYQGIKKKREEIKLGKAFDDEVARAVTLFESKRWQEAIKVINALLEKDPEATDPMHGSIAALLYRALEQKDLAELPTPPKVTMPPRPTDLPEEIKPSKSTTRRKKRTKEDK